MRLTIYRAFLGLPFRIGGSVIAVGGIVASLWPNKVKDAIGGTEMTIHNVGNALLIAALFYFVLLWLLKPGPSAGPQSSLVISGPNPTVHFHHHYGDLVGETNQVQSENESAAEATPLNHFLLPTVTQTGGQLEDATLSATGVLFPLGLFVGMVIVSAGRLSEENTLELVIRAFNGTGRQLRLAFIEGAIHGGQGNLRDLPGLPLPTRVPIGEPRPISALGIR